MDCALGQPGDILTPKPLHQADRLPAADVQDGAVDVGVASRRDDDQVIDDSDAVEERLDGSLVVASLIPELPPMTTILCPARVMTFPTA